MRLKNSQKWIFEKKKKNPSIARYIFSHSVLYVFWVFTRKSFWFRSSCIYHRVVRVKPSAEISNTRLAVYTPRTWRALVRAHNVPYIISIQWHRGVHAKIADWQNDSRATEKNAALLEILVEKNNNKISICKSYILLCILYGCIINTVFIITLHERHDDNVFLDLCSVSGRRLKGFIRAPHTTL